MSRIGDRLKEQLEAAVIDESRKELRRYEEAKIYLMEKLSLCRIEKVLTAQVTALVVEINYDCNYSIKIGKYEWHAIKHDPEIREQLQKIANEGLFVSVSLESVTISFDPFLEEEQPTGELDLSEIDAVFANDEG
jgi:hypothetical protein